MIFRKEDVVKFKCKEEEKIGCLLEKRQDANRKNYWLVVLADKKVEVVFETNMKHFKEA